MAYEICRICGFFDNTHISLPENLRRSIANIDFSNNDKVCVECWNSVVKLHVMELMIRTPIGTKWTDNDQLCLFCRSNADIGSHHQNLSNELVVLLRSTFKIELTTDDPLCRRCWNFVVKFRMLQLMLQQPQRIEGYWSGKSCRFCQTIGNHKQLLGEFIPTLQNIFKIDFTNDDLVCRSCHDAVVIIDIIPKYIVSDSSKIPPQKCYVSPIDPNASTSIAGVRTPDLSEDSSPSESVSTSTSSRCVKRNISDTTTAKDACNKLEVVFEDSGLFRKVELLKQLVKLTLSKCESVEEINRMVTTIHKVRKAGLKIEDDVLASLVCQQNSNHWSWQ